MTDQIPTYLALDCETGGLSFTETSLLTVYLIVLDQNLEPMNNGENDYEITLKPENGIYQVTADALRINKIDLVKHHSEAYTAAEYSDDFEAWLLRQTENGKYKLSPLGHNVAFDVELVKAQVLETAKFNKYVKYRVFDTGTIATYLQAVGALDERATGGLEALVTLFGVEKLAHHTAKGDTLMTVELAKAMVNHLKLLMIEAPR